VCNKGAGGPEGRDAVVTEERVGISVSVSCSSLLGVGEGLLYEKGWYNNENFEW